MPKQGEQDIHFSLLYIGPGGEPGPTMGNYDTLEEAVNNWIENYTEDGPNIAIVRVFSELNSELQIHEVTKMEVVSEEEVESVMEDEMSDVNLDDQTLEINESADSIEDEHPDWPLKEFHAIVNYIDALDEPELEVAPISIHDSLAEAKEEFARKGYSNDYSIVVRQLKVNPLNPKEYYLFDEWDAE